MTATTTYGIRAGEAVHRDSAKGRYHETTWLTDVAEGEGFRRVKVHTRHDPARRIYYATASIDTFALRGAFAVVSFRIERDVRTLLRGERAGRYSAKRLAEIHEAALAEFDPVAFFAAAAATEVAVA